MVCQRRPGSSGIGDGPNHVRAVELHGRPRSQACPLVEHVDELERDDREAAGGWRGSKRRATRDGVHRDRIWQLDDLIEGFELLERLPNLRP
jgi:hypothetical protein